MPSAPAAARFDLDSARSDVVAACRQLLADCPPETTSAAEFLGARFDRGLGWVAFGDGDGGRALPPQLQSDVEATLAAAGAPRPSASTVIGHGMGAPTVATHGTPEQRRRFLRPLFTGEEIWCQLFSEPGAGSDLANVTTRAERAEGGWRINGQKVWTSFAHLARWAMLLTRTDVSVPKHRGLTYFVLDMTAPGVDVRPLFQITGEAEFNEVFLTDVFLPDTARLGEVGAGWSVALTTLMNERVSIGGETPPRGAGLIGHAVELWKDTGRHDPVQRDRLTELWVRAEVLRLTNIASRQRRTVGTPGPEGSVGKLLLAELHKDITEAALDWIGWDAMTLPGGYPMCRPEAASAWTTAQQAFLRARANSIEGGTTEIMRNILGERVLGLPPEPRVDKDAPFDSLPRSG